MSIYLNKWSLLILFASFYFVSCQNISSASESVDQLVKWENLFNNGAKKSNKSIALKHYEIPLRLLEKDIDQNINPKMKESLIFKKNGEEYVRWIIHPEDTKYHLKVKKFLAKHNIDNEEKKFFTAFTTSSRSLILINPENGSSFSLKISTDNAGGTWADKVQTWTDAIQIRQADELLQEVTTKMKTKHLIFMNEPLALGIKKIDQGMIMRSLNDLPENTHFYLPGFSAIHEEEGKRIAKINGSSNVLNFWNKHYIQPLAQAMAELLAYTGGYPDSPHSQNFLIELDTDMKPTGRIVFRDIGDMNFLKDFVINTENETLLLLWNKSSILTKNEARVGTSLFKWTGTPTWMTDNYNASTFMDNFFENQEKTHLPYLESFYATFEEKFSELTGISQKELNDTTPDYDFGELSRKRYNTTTLSWQNYLKNANCFSGERKTKDGLDCPQFIIDQQKKNKTVRIKNTRVKPSCLSFLKSFF